MNTKRRGKIGTGFTLIEMLAVVAVIMILAAMLLPVIGKTRARSIRTECLNNIKQADLLLLMYGHENNDRLPQTASMTTLPPPLVEMAMRGRISHQIFYDPGIDDQSSNWFIVSISPGREIGYYLTLPGIPSLHATNVNATILPQPISMVSGANVVLPPPNASERVLIAGATWPPPWGGSLNAHVDSKNYPLGDNVAMLDGSAKWRKFKDMTGRLSKAYGGPDYGVRW